MTQLQHPFFIRFAGWSGITSAMLYLVSILGMLQYFQGDLTRPLHFAQNIVDHQTHMFIYSWPGLAATLLIIPLVMVIQEGNESQVGIHRLVRMVTMLGLTLIAIGYLFQLAFSYYLAPMMVSAPAEEQTSFGLLIQAVVGLQDMFWLNGDLLAFLGVGLLLVLTLKGGQFPAWLSWIGILAGVFAAIGSFSFVPAMKESILGLLFLGGFSVFALWEIMAGIYLVRK